MPQISATAKCPSLFGVGGLHFYINKITIVISKEGDTVMAKEESMKEKSERWDRYQESLRKARKNYLSDKKTITAVIRQEEYDEVKAYCEARGYSLQELIRETLLERVRS